MLRRNHLVLALALAVLAAGRPASAQQSWGSGSRARSVEQAVRHLARGTPMRIAAQPADLVGSFVSCNPETLVLLRSGRYAVHIPVETIRRIRVRHDSRAGTRAFGFVVGGVVGAAFGYGVVPTKERCVDCAGPFRRRRTHPLTFVLGGATLGVVIGGSLPVHVSWQDVYVAPPAPVGGR